MGLAAMVLGIVAFPISLFCYLGIPLGVLAIIFGLLGRRRAARGEATNPGQAMIGLVLGVLGLVLTVVIVTILTLVRN